MGQVIDDRFDEWNAFVINAIRGKIYPGNTTPEELESRLDSQWLSRHEDKDFNSVHN